MIKRNKMSANFTGEGGTTAVSAEDATPLGINVVAGDNVGLTAAVICSSTFAGRADVFVLATVPVTATVPVVVSC